MKMIITDYLGKTFTVDTDTQSLGMMEREKYDELLVYVTGYTKYALKTIKVQSGTGREILNKFLLLKENENNNL